MKKLFIYVAGFLFLGFYPEAQIMHPHQVAKKQAGNSSSPKKSSAKGVNKNSALSNSKTEQDLSKKATLLLVPNADCEIIIDANNIGQTKTYTPLKAEVNLGTHLITCKSLSDKSILQQSVEIKSLMQKTINLDLLSVINSAKEKASKNLVEELDENSPNTEKIKKYILEGAEINTKGKNGASSLHIAAIKNDRDLAQLLLAKGINANAPTSTRVTPLHFTGVNNSFDVAKLLINHGADVNAEDNWKDTPLHWAARKGNIRLASLFLDNGANLNARNEKGATPLDLSTKYDMDALLKSYGGN